MSAWAYLRVWQIREYGVWLQAAAQEQQQQQRVSLTDSIRGKGKLGDCTMGCSSSA
jgi:hypothetical protein